MLKITSVNVAYGKRRVLHNITLTVQPGSVVALIGPNGAGKSSLIRAISGTLPLQSGHITIRDQEVSHLSPQQRARWMAVVPQARNLPGAFTAFETVAFGRTPYLNWFGQLSKSDEEAVTQAMRRTGSAELADRQVGELSGGEQQRLLVARALAQSAPYLLMDEPTTHLDLQHQLGVLNLVRDLAHQDGLAVLLALHDLNLVARFADQVALLVGGEIQAYGEPGDVLNASQLSQAYHVPLQVVPSISGHPSMIMPV